MTVLFADLAGFTTLSGELDAEELHAILNRYFDTTDAVIQRYGGQIDKHIGDGVMAVFGAPIAHTDDPERAVRAALDIHRAMGELSHSIGRELSAHVGIASGEVVASGTGSNAFSEYTVIGMTVNLASRLDDLAESGETLVSDDVYEAVSRRFLCVDRGSLTVKGIAEPVRAWSVEGPLAETAKRPVGKLLGRRMELSQFRALREECVFAGEGCCLLVRGDPGIGKTRLVEAFIEDAESQGFKSIRGLVLDFGTSHGNDTINALLLGLLAIPQSSDAEDQEIALQRAIAKGWLPEDLRVFAANLLAVPRSPESKAIYNNMDYAAREAGCRETLTKLVLAQSEENPLLVIVEDIHWADAQTLAYLSDLAREIADTPVLLVMTSRIEGASTQGDWFGKMSGASHSVMELQPLSGRESRALAESLVPNAKQDLGAFVERSGGNPLYLELLMRNLDEITEETLPSTIQGLVLSRIDRLSPVDKAVLQAGSAIGQKMTLELLRHMACEPGYDAQGLVEHRLLKAEGEDFLFEHALIRDGVYASLLGSRRRQLHLRAAEWFQDRDPVLWSEHLDRAEDPDAANAYLAAATAVAADFRPEKALELLRRGLEIVDEDRLRFQLLKFDGEILEILNQFDESASVWEAATSIAPTRIDACHCLTGHALALLRSDRHSEADNLLNEAAAIASDLNLKKEQALIHRRRATIEFARGNNRATFSESQAALDLAEELGLVELEAEALSCLADAEAAAGKFVSARAYYTRCIDICRANDLRRFAIVNEKMLGDNAFYRGELMEARANFERVVENSTELRDVRSEALARNMLSYLDNLAGRAEAAMEHARRAEELIESIDIRRFLMNTYCLLAMAHRVNGSPKIALSHLDDAESLAKELNVIWSMPWVYGERAMALGPGKGRNQSLDKGMELLAAGHGGYFTFEFFRPAIEAALDSQDWPRAEKLCDAFSKSMGDEPVGLPEYVINRAKAIIAARNAVKNDDLISKVHAQALEMELLVDLPAICDAMGQ
ncbi:AAA family ATPase [Ruegeria conchae]|uniref:adenylate/guanylate cyclase domain-containing protein n=1 Tax=Ruegeria conchae TaxID=981384 RepID=UPI0021A6BEDA|nr:adenylate/guanylate cyclase domain-containing protein [Ruegeria conchae]UWR02374.1 AAA family ATPase [Ruegeria conchae]